MVKLTEDTLMEKYVNLAGRILLAHIFLLAGLNKISGYSGTQGYMEAMGVPGVLLPCNPECHCNH